jgi:hypothetical protein
MTDRNAVYCCDIAPPSVRRSGAALGESLARAAGNTGNFFISDGIRRTVSGVKIVGDWEDTRTVTGTLILAFANTIHDGCDVSRQLWFLERCKAERIVIIGIGAQAYTDNTAPKLGPDLLRLLEIVEERSASIGVRGQFTAEILNKAGFKNIDVIGCPSLFADCNRDLRVNKYRLPSECKLSTGATLTGYYKDKLGEFLAFAQHHDATYIAQDELNFAALRKEDNSKMTDEVLYYCPGALDPVAMQAWLEKRTYIYFNVTDWIDHVRNTDFAVGSRFHGNVAATRAGIPNLTLVFDTRTREMCEYLCMPFMFLKDFSGNTSAAELYEMADPTLFNAVYPSRYDAYANFLQNNSIPTTLVPQSSDKANASLGPMLNDLTTVPEKVKQRSIESFLENGGPPSGDKLLWLHNLALRLGDLRPLETCLRVEAGQALPEQLQEEMPNFRKTPTAVLLASLMPQLTELCGHSVAAGVRAILGAAADAKGPDF